MGWRYACPTSPDRGLLKKIETVMSFNISIIHAFAFKRGLHGSKIDSAQTKVV